MSKREGYGKQMERKLAGWKTQLDTATAAAAASGTSTKADTDRLDSWKTAGDAATAKLVELRAAAAHYGVIRGELETAWQAIAGVLPGGESVEAPQVGRASSSRVA